MASSDRTDPSIEDPNLFSEALLVPVVLIGTNGDDVLTYFTSGIPNYVGGNGQQGAVMSGLAGNDQLLGSFGADVMSGGEGNDFLRGHYGNDTIDGGNGTDTADYSYYGRYLSRLAQPRPGEANLGVTIDLGNGFAQGKRSNLTDGDVLLSIENAIGSRFNDTMLGSAAGNILEGGDGHDYIFGFDGHDQLSGGIGDDYLAGGEGNDFLVGGLGKDYMAGGAGSDYASYRYLKSDHAVTVLLWQGSATAGPADIDALIDIENVVGTNLGDHIEGDAANNLLLGEKGDDWLVGLDGNDQLYGDEGNDIIVGGAGIDEMHGGSGTDTLEYIGSATGVRVSLAGGWGELGDAEGDTFTDIENLKGSAFTDMLAGDDGDNTIMGFDGDDIIGGGDGSNLLYGDGGNDLIVGGNGADTISGGAGADGIHGNGGLDTIIFNDANEGVSVNLSTGTGRRGDAEGDSYSGIENIRGTAFDDTLIGNTARNLLIGSVGDDRLEGRGGADLLEGEDGADILDGGNGADSLWGGWGRDVIIGGAGDDFIVGGRDRDEMTGGSGADVFEYLDIADSGTGIGGDYITDFELGIDIIYLEHLDAVIGFEQLNQEFSFIGADAFSDTAGELRYFSSKDRTFIEADVNGDGTADFGIVLAGTHALTAGDFVL